MRRVIVLLLPLLLSSFACVRYQRVAIGPGNPDGAGCVQRCKQAHHDDDAIVECASTCPGALVRDDGECPTEVAGEPEPATACVATVHVRWGRIAKVAGVMAGAALIVTALLMAALLSAPTH